MRPPLVSAATYNTMYRFATNILTDQTIDDLLANLLDIHNQRLAHMDATGVDFVRPPPTSLLELTTCEY